MTLRPGQKKKVQKKVTAEKQDDKIDLEKVVQDVAPKKRTPIFGVQEIAAFLGYSMRTAHRWRMEFEDFPVKSDGVSCVWESTVEELEEWKNKHTDLFRYRKEREEIAMRQREKKRFHRW